MGKASKALKEFIREIPEAKLTGFPPSGGTIYPSPVRPGDNFRLDMQGITTNGEFNLQIQANSQAKITSVREQLASQTVAGPVIIGQNENVSAEEVRQRLLNAMLI